MNLENFEAGLVRFAWGDDGHSTLPALKPETLTLKKKKIGEVRFAWGDDGHSTLPAAAPPPMFSWQSKAPRKVLNLNLNPTPYTLHPKL